MSNLSISTGKSKTIGTAGAQRGLRFHHWCQYVLLHIVGTLVRWMPLPVGRSLGRFLGGVLHFFDRRHRRIILLNMDRVFGERKSESEKRTLCRAMYRFLGEMAIEILKSHQITHERLADWVVFENTGVIDRALAEGRGVLLCTAHLGNWELMNTALSLEGHSLDCLARPMDNPLIHRYLEKRRTRNGTNIIYKYGGALKMLGQLRKNRIVAMVIDQNVNHGSRIMVDFFGEPASSTPLPATLAIESGAPIIVGFCVPREDGRYHIAFQEPIFASGSASNGEDVIRVTREIHRRLEAQIEATPACWYWLNRRFKNDAEGITDFYQRERAIGF